MTKVPFGARVYFTWLIIIIFAVLPLIWKNLLSIWRLTTWLAPTILALDADAGDRPWIYYGKAVIGVLMQLLSMKERQTTKNSHAFRPSLLGIRDQARLPVMAALFVLTCSLTLIGHHRRKYITVGGLRALKKRRNLRLVDKSVREKPYADFRGKTLRTPLLPSHLIGAWITDDDDQIKILKPEEVQRHVVRISFVTQYVLSRTFKDADNSVFVYSSVARYRALLLCIALGCSGVYHVGQALFSNDPKEQDIIQSLLLWLTLPTITVPAILKIKFGNIAKPSYLLRGFLPVKSDEDMCARLNVTSKDLFSAMANAEGTENIFCSNIGIITSGGAGKVYVSDVKKARLYCKQAMLGVGNWHYIRVSDGKRFLRYEFIQRREMPFDSAHRWQQKEEEEGEGLDCSSKQQGQESSSMRTSCDDSERYHHVVDIKDEWTLAWETYGGVL